MKNFIYSLVNRLPVSNVFRYLNKNKILILAYHGITEKRYDYYPWTFLPLEIFEQQLIFFKKHYQIVPLPDIVEAINFKKNLPSNPAVITFDDGYRNNLLHVLPLLQKYQTPATIFLTTGYINSDRLLPMDVVYLLIMKSKNSLPYPLQNDNRLILKFHNREEKIRSIKILSSFLKKKTTREQQIFLHRMITDLKVKIEDDPKTMMDFSLLSWSEVVQLNHSGLFNIGAHTVNHEILANVSPNQACQEIIQSKKMIEEQLGKEINLFAYPNGQIGDYSENNIQCLKENDFNAAVTTVPILNHLSTSPFELGRMSVGSDFSSNQNYFVLRSSGFIPILKSWISHVSS